MRTAIRYFFTLLFLFSPFTLYANTAAEDLTQILSDLHSMQADFKQTTLDAQGKVLQRSQGKMALQRPGKFRWDTQEPAPQQLIADGKYIWIYDVDLEQVVRKRQTNNAETAPAMLLSGSTASLLQRFIVKTIQTSRPSEMWFQLLPRAKESFYASVNIGFKAGVLHEIQIVSQLGQTSRLTFYRVVENPSLSHSLFRFSPPDGVDVIHE